MRHGGSGYTSVSYVKLPTNLLSVLANQSDYGRDGKGYGKEGKAGKSAGNGRFIHRYSRLYYY